MDKIYPDRLEFVNGSVPALNDTNLNKMSKALDDLDDRVIEVSGDIMTVVPEVREMLEEADALVESARVSASNASASEINAERYAQEAASGSGGNNLDYKDEMLQLKRDNVVLSAVHISGGGGGGSNEWVGTHAEYEAIKDTIPDGYFVTFTDDANPLETYAIVNSATEVLINDEDDVIAGAKAVKDFQTYSTEETVCGKWIDGKTLYRQVFVGNISRTTGQQDFDIATNFVSGKNIIKIDGTLRRNDNQNVSPLNVNYNNDSNSYNSCFTTATGDLFIRFGSAPWQNSSCKYTVIVEYVKE